MSLLKWVMSMFTTEDKPENRPAPLDRSKTIEIIHEEEKQEADKPAGTQRQDTIPETDQSEPAEPPRDQQEPEVNQSEEGKAEEQASQDAVAPEVDGDDLENNNLADDDLGEDTEDYADDPDFASSSDDSDDDSDDGIVDKVSSPIQMKVGKRSEYIYLGLYILRFLKFS